MKKTDSKNLLYKGVIILLCLIFVGGVIWGANDIMAMEGTVEPYVPGESLTPVPETNQEYIDYINALLKKAIETKPKLSSSDSASIESDSIETENEEIKNIAVYIKDSITSSLSSTAKTFSVGYDEGFADIINTLDINADDVESASCSYIYYRCSVCGETENESPEICSACDSLNTYEIRYRDNYSLNIKLKDDSDAVEKYFNLYSPEAVNQVLSEGADGYFKNNLLSYSVYEPTISISVNRLTDEIQNISFNIKSDVSADVEFIGDLEKLGTANIDFTLSHSYMFSFSWADLNITTDELVLSHSSQEVLVAKLTCDDPTKAQVTWTSSDPALATVDEDGYVKANKKNDGVVTITASFDFNGKTYSDTCTVYVQTAVEGIVLEKRNLKLEVGETYQESVKFEPKNASVQTVTWHTSDESIATVDANGLITAVKTGEVTIWAISDDGYYKSSCNVEVK